MASAWDTSWDTSWGDSWGVVGGAAAVVAAVKTGTGGIDQSRRRGNKAWQINVPVKKQRDTQVEKRVAETAKIHAEVAGELAKELRESADQIGEKSVAEMTTLEVDTELGVLLRGIHTVRLAQQRQTEDEESLVLMTFML